MMKSDIEFEIHRTTREYHLAGRGDLVHRLVLAGIYLNAGGAALVKISGPGAVSGGGTPAAFVLGLIFAFISGFLYFLYTSSAIRLTSDQLRGEPRESAAAIVRQLLQASVAILPLSYVFLALGLLA